jgi:nitrogenase molybdenum-iron protein NifN
MESGYALAVKAMIDVLVPESQLWSANARSRSTCWPASLLTPGDLEHIKELIEMFGLRPVLSCRTCRIRWTVT